MKGFVKTIRAIHKLTGTAMCLLFLMYCLTGFVMLFFGFPHASRQDRFLKLGELTGNHFADIQSLPESYAKGYELELFNNKLVYRINKGKKDQIVIDAKTLETISSFSLQDCKTTALSYIDAEIIKTDSLSNLDSWTPWEYYKPLLPFYKFYLNDAKHTVLYTSQKSGQIIQQTNRKTRWLARFGAIPHLIYFKQIKSRAKLWENLILVLGLFGLLVCISGIAMGIIRIKRNEKGNISGLTVYKKPLYKYHHILGLFFGLLLFTYTLSGIFYTTGVPSWIVKKKEGIAVNKQWNKEKNIIHLHPHSIFKQFAQQSKIRKIAWGETMQAPVVKIYCSDYKTPKIFSIDSLGRIKSFSADENKIRALAQKLYPKTNPKISTLTTYNYYYKQSGMFHHPLPVYKLELNNVYNDVLYIDPQTGKAVEYSNKNLRTRQILTKTLHKLELPMLYKYNTLRILLSIAVLVALTIISFTSFVLGIKYLKRNLFNQKQYECKK